MSSEHGPVTQMSIREIAEFLNKLLPPRINKSHNIVPLFKAIASDDEIWKGVLAYRDFLHTFFVALAAHGHTYFKLKNKPKSETDYPFLYALADLLSDIGYFGELSDDHKTMRVTKLPSFTVFTDKNGRKKSAKNSVRLLTDCIAFLESLGLVIEGHVIKNKKISLEDTKTIHVSYTESPHLMLGLKVLAIADIELREKRYKNDFNHDNILSCDYRLICASDLNYENMLKDYLNTISNETQTMLVNLHKTCLDMGLTCVKNASTFDVHFAYAFTGRSKKPLSERDVYKKRIWEVSISAKHGYGLVVRSKKTDKYQDLIKTLSMPIQERIDMGYGCDRKLRNEPCQGGCEGFRFPLDDTFENIRDDIKIWIEKESECTVG